MFSSMFIVDCTHIGFAPPAMEVSLASVLTRGGLTQLSPNHARKAEVSVFKDSEASKKAWLKIHQKNALKGLDKLSVEIANMHAMPESKAKQKAMDKISAQASHLEQKFLANGGNPSDFLDAQMMAYNKAAEHQPSTGLQDLSPTHSTTTPSTAAPSPAKTAPKWDDPTGFASDQVAHALDQNHKLGVAYYVSRETKGKDHQDTQDAYAEWQKSKDYLTGGAGFDKDFIGAKSSKSKDAALLQIKDAQSALNKEAAAKIKVIEDLQSHAYNAGYHGLMDPNSHQAQQSVDPLQNSKLLAELDGHTPEAIKSMVIAAKAKGIKAATEAKKLKELLDGGTASVLKYHDKVAFEDLSQHSGQHVNTAYAIEARKITDKLSEAESQAVKSYAGSGYTEQNKAIAAGKTTTYATLMKKVMDKASLPVDAKLRRNMAQKWFWKALGVDGGVMHNLSDSEIATHVGKTYTEDAFSSTSKDLSFTAAFGKTAQTSGKIQMNIRAPKGSQALDVSYHVSNHGEAEIILNRGATYVIRAIRKRGGHGQKNSGSFAYEVDVDLIGFKKDGAKA